MIKDALSTTGFVMIICMAGMTGDPTPSVIVWLSVAVLFLWLGGAFIPLRRGKKVKPPRAM